MTNYRLPLTLIALTLVLASCGQTDGNIPSLGSTISGSSGTSCDYKMFVTSSTYNGNLGGVSGADSKCASDANHPGLGTYKALIVDSWNRVACTTSNCTGGTSEHWDWVLRENSTYCKLDGTTIIGTTNNVGLLNYPLTNALVTSSTAVWTGITANWTNNVDCSSWTSSTFSTDRAHNGNLGDAGATSSSFSGAANLFVQCGNTKKIICVQQ